MSNDRIIIEKILEQKHQSIAPEQTQSVFFELFCATELLKDIDLSYDEIWDGIVGGGHDGGMDSIVRLQSEMEFSLV